jgi:hypothetical protein
MLQRHPFINLTTQRERSSFLPFNGKNIQGQQINASIDMHLLPEPNLSVNGRWLNFHSVVYGSMRVKVALLTQSHGCLALVTGINETAFVTSTGHHHDAQMMTGGMKHSLLFSRSQ